MKFAFPLWNDCRWYTCHEVYHLHMTLANAQFLAFRTPQVVGDRRVRNTGGCGFQAVLGGLNECQGPPKDANLSIFSCSPVRLCTSVNWGDIFVPMPRYHIHQIEAVQIEDLI
jgi:hypothetical protein